MEFRTPRPLTLWVLAAASLFVLSACSDSENTVGPPDPLPPPVDGDGDLRIVGNTPADFPPEAFRVDFAVAPPASGSPVLRDRVTGSLFSLDGYAYSGPLATEGVRLPMLSKLSAFWFAWSVFYPGSEIWGRDTGVRDAIIGSDETCLVPCNQIRFNLNPDAIPSLPNIGPPKRALNFVGARSPQAAYLQASDLVVGIFDGVTARAYPHNVLWWHEIINDKSGALRLSVTFCPLTGSALVFGAETSAYGTSGSLYNSNLVMYDHSTRSLIPQLRRQAVLGSRKGETLPEIPFVETTWGRWRAMHPETQVIGSTTGFDRNYQSYPYGDYRFDNQDTFGATDPSPDPTVPNKARVTGVQVGQTHRVYVHDIVASQNGLQAVFRDEFESMPLWIVFDRPASYLQIFNAADPSHTLDLEWTTAP